MIVKSHTIAALVQGFVHMTSTSTCTVYPNSMIKQRTQRNILNNELQVLNTQHQLHSISVLGQK